MHDFTPIASTIGGMLIGLSATLMLLGLGRIAGVSGIFGELVARPSDGEVAWRLLFVLGLVAGGAVMYLASPELFAAGPDPSVVRVAAAGLLVGFGTRMGRGCTSGHGVCGLSRLSVRSLVAPSTFMATGAATVFLVGHVLGGAR